MLELFAGLSDDQKALIGCAAAVLVCGGLLSASRFFGNAVRRVSPARSDAPAVLRLPVAGLGVIASQPPRAGRRAA